MTLALALALAGCVETQQAVDDVARRSAKAAVSEAIVTRLPGVPAAAVTPFTDCVIDNASALEIRELAKAAVVGVNEATVAVVETIAGRPETRQCITRAGVAALGA